MSPEQARRRKIPIDHRTDIYSLGATLYEVLTLEPPFRGKDHQDTLSQIIERDPVEPRRVNTRVPKELETVVLKCLRKDVADRYGTAEALAQDLRRFVRGDPIEARPQARWERLARRAWRTKWRIGAVAAVVLLIAVSAFLAVKLRSEAIARKAVEYERQVRGAVRGMSLGTFLTTVETREEVKLRSDFNFLPLEDYLELMRSDEHGTVDESLDKLSRAALDLPQRPEAHYHQARVLLLVRRTEEALKNLNLARQADPGFAPAAVLEASILEDLGKKSQAAALVQSLVLSSGGSWAAAYVAAQRAMKEKRWQDAAEAFDKIIQLEEAGREAYVGSSLDARLGRGWAKFLLKDFLGALEDSTVAERDWQSDFAPLLLKGAAYFNLGFKEKAEAVFQQSYARSGSRDVVALSVVGVYLADSVYLRETDRALAWSEKLRSEKLRLRFRSFCLFWLGRCKDAVAESNRAREIYPDDPATYRILSHALTWGTGAYEDGERVAREALRRFPGFLMFYDPLASALWYQRKFAESRDVLSEAIRLNSNDGFFYMKLAMSLIALGEIDEAFRMHAKALELSPDHVDVATCPGWHLAEIGRLEEATEVLDRCCKKYPRGSGPFQEKARILERQGKFEEALQVAKQAAVLPPKEPWINVRAGKLLERLGRLDEAFSTYAMGVEDFPEDQEHLRELSLLEHRQFESKRSGSTWDKLAGVLEKARLGREHDGRLLNTLALVHLHGEAKKDLAKGLQFSIEAAQSSNRREADILATLADAQFLVGEKSAAVVTLEEALELPEAEKSVRRRLESYRKAALPDLPSCASIDAALEAAGGDKEHDRELLEDFRAVASGDNVTSRLSYLEGGLHERAGRLPEATIMFFDLAAKEKTRPEPVLRLATCLRSAGDGTAAVERLWSALAAGFAHTRELWELWAAISLSDLRRNPADLLASMPDPKAAGPSNGFVDDLRWLFVQLRDAGSVRIHCGGSGVTGKSGEVWGSDRFSVGGHDTRKAWLWGTLDAFPGEIQGTGTVALYKTNRWFPSEQDHMPGYRIPLPNGAYRVTLHFAEVQWAAPTLRRFGVLIEGQEVLKDHDVFVTAGFATANVQEFAAEVKDGLLEIGFVPRVDNPMVSAIEVEPVR